MGEQHYTFTPISTDEHTLINFSGEVPRLTMAYVSVKEGIGKSQAVTELQTQLGESAVLLSQRDELIASLQERIAALESVAVQNTVELDNNSAQDQQTDQSEPCLDPTPLPVEDAHITEAPEQIEVVADEDLSPASQRAERAIIYLLQQPDMKITSHSATGELRQAIGIEKLTDWSNLRQKLEGIGIIETVKSPTHPKRLSEISLNLECLIAAMDKPFITPRVLRTLKETSEKERAAQETTGEAPTSNNDHVDNNGHAQNSNGHRSVHAISPRVRRAIAEDTHSNGSSYRERGKGARKAQEEPKPFLAHRREVTGVKRP